MGGTAIENYTVCQTVENLNALVLDKYNEEKAKAKAAGKSEAGAEREAEFKAKQMPELLAVQKWLDNNAEISLKKAIEQMMNNLKIPALIIRSINIKAISLSADFRCPWTP